MRPRQTRADLDGWRALSARSDDGTFESDERVRVAGPVVEFSEHGARVARCLGDALDRRVGAEIENPEAPRS